MVVIWPPPSMVPTVMPIIEQAFKNHDLLSNKMLALAADRPRGPYALFNHNAQVHERMTDVKTIVTRLAENRKLLTELTRKEEQLRPKIRRYKKTLSKPLQAVVQQANTVHQQMKLDMESLFLFGNLLLEQWTYVILYLVGERDLKMHDFSKLVTTLQAKEEKGLLLPLWQQHHNDMIWLYYQLRSFR